MKLPWQTNQNDYCKSCRSNFFQSIFCNKFDTTTLYKNEFLLAQRVHLFLFIIHRKSLKQVRAELSRAQLQLWLNKIKQTNLSNSVGLILFDLVYFQLSSMNFNVLQFVYYINWSSYLRCGCSGFCVLFIELSIVGIAHENFILPSWLDWHFCFALLCVICYKKYFPERSLLSSSLDGDCDTNTSSAQAGAKLELGLSLVIIFRLTLKNWDYSQIEF